MRAALDFGGFKGTNASPGSAPGDLATIGQLNGYLPRSGGTITGELRISGITYFGPGSEFYALAAEDGRRVLNFEPFGAIVYNSAGPRMDFLVGTGPSRMAIQADGFVYALNGFYTSGRVQAAGEVWAANGAARLGTDGNVIGGGYIGGNVRSHIEQRCSDYRASGVEQGLGRGQAWTDQTGNRGAGATYQNDTGKPIEVVVCGDTNSDAITFQVSSDNSSWINVAKFKQTGTVSVIVPPGHFYRTNGFPTIFFWSELR